MSSYYVRFVFFFKQKTAYEMRISDWSSDVCSSDLIRNHYFVEVFADRRANPRDDMISDLVTKEIDGAPLSIPELLSILNQLLVAGTETTTSAIASSIVRLANEPELVELLANDPAKCDNIAEEIMRTDSPVQGDRKNDP